MNERSDKTAQLLRELVEHIQEDVDLDSVSPHFRECLSDAQDHLLEERIRQRTRQLREARLAFSALLASPNATAADYDDIRDILAKYDPLPELVEHIQEKVAVQEREEIIAILSETEFTSLDHMPSEAALIIRLRGGE